MNDKVTATDQPIAKIWGEYAPGKVFWDDVEAPENSVLMEGDERAQALKSNELRDVRRKLKRVTDALAVWDHASHPARLNYYRKRANAAQDSKERDEWRAKYTEAKNNPPPEPRLSFWQRLFKPRDPLVIKSEKQAQKLRLWMDRIHKRLAEHETALRNQAIYDQLAAEMQLEVSYFAQRIIHRWTALQNREEIYVKGKRKFIRVGIEEAIYTEDEIQYKIRVAFQTVIGASRHVLPDGVTAWNLVKPETLSELTAACERPVGSPHVENTPESFQNGAWVVVYREGLTDGLFDYIEYGKVITKYDPASRTRLPVPIGVMRGRMLQWLYLDEHPHLMVNGISGSGKTNVIRACLTTWTQYHSPDEIRIYLVDLKRGGDYRKFAAVPHLAAPIMTTASEMADAMPKLVALMYQRMDTFSQHACRDIIDYNEQHPETRMEHIVFIIDECGAVNALAGKESGGIIWQAATLISTQARAAGIHLLLGTQQSFSEAIPKAVRDNVTFVLSGRQRTLAASMATFGTGRAKALPKIRGRMYCDDGGDMFQVQTPFVSKEDEARAIEIAMQYGEFAPLLLPDADVSILEAALIDEDETAPAADMPAPQFGVEDVIRLAVEQFDGVLNARKIHEMDTTPRSVTRRDILDMISDIANLDVVEYGADVYAVVKRGKGYKLELIQASNDSITHDDLALAGD